MKKLLLPLLIAAASPIAHASVDLIAIGSLGGTSDLSGLTGTLENGVAANVLGGIGSGLAWAGGNTFIALPDRGPNATPYNAAIDNTTSYISRFQTVTLNLTQSSSGSLPYTLTPTLTGTTLLSSPTALSYGTASAPALNDTNGTNYFIGRADAFGAGNSGNANNARLDPEGIRVSNDGKSVFVSDEYGPYVYQFDRTTGARLRTFTLPTNLDVSVLGNEATEVNTANNTTGRVANKGMEGLAITPDGKTLVGIMQASLLQDASKQLRLVTIDIETGATKEYGYKLTNGSGVSEIIALNDHQFIVDERDGKGLGDGTLAVVKQLFTIDLTGATDITGLSALTTSNYTPVAKSAQPFLDIRTALVAAGINAADIPAKLEAVSFGEDIVVNGVTKHTLYVANDNDFLASVLNANGSTILNTNNFYVFSFTDADLNGMTFQQQNINAVPVPAAAWLFGSALAGMLRLRRKNRA